MQNGNEKEERQNEDYQDNWEERYKLVSEKLINIEHEHKKNTL